MCIQVFPYNSRMEAYLKSTGRHDIAASANTFKNILTPDAKAPYDQVRKHILQWHCALEISNYSSDYLLINGPYGKVIKFNLQ